MSYGILTHFVLILCEINNALSLPRHRDVVS